VPTVVSRGAYVGCFGGLTHGYWSDFRVGVCRRCHGVGPTSPSRTHAGLLNGTPDPPLYFQLLHCWTWFDSCTVEKNHEQDCHVYDR
jgi:hypothetical protein